MNPLTVGRQTPQTLRDEVANKSVPLSFTSWNNLECEKWSTREPGLKPSKLKIPPEKSGVTNSFAYLLGGSEVGGGEGLGLFASHEVGYIHKTQPRTVQAIQQ